MAAPRGYRILLLFPLALLPLLASAGLVLEDGYAVSTAADLNPRAAASWPGAHPHVLLPRPRAADLVLLDSAGSALYTLAIPLGGGGGGAPPRALAGGGGRVGFDDGGPGAAAFSRPRSIAVDGADNVYVADRANGAIRKIAPSGDQFGPPAACGD